MCILIWTEPFRCSCVDILKWQ